MLQHPKEAGKALGTARMAHLSLPGSSLHVGTSWDESDVLRRACSDPDRPPVLLHPGPDARDLLADPPRAPVTLIVPDGTWSQTRALVRASRELGRLPRYAFQPPEPSRYRIREEPSPEHVSTIEALAWALGAIEGEPERFRALLRPFQVMVDAHLAARNGQVRSRWMVRRRLPLFERLPTALRERYDDLVLVFGDANAWPTGAPERDLGDELVHWVAHRPSTGAAFSFVIAPTKPLAPEVPCHVGLTEDQLRGGGAASEMLAAFDAFLRPSDVLASWGYHGLRLYKNCGGRLPGPFLDLHGVARTVTREKTGSLDRFAARHGIQPQAGHPAGRAGRRLGLLLSLVAGWRASA